MLRARRGDRDLQMHSLFHYAIIINAWLLIQLFDKLITWRVYLSCWLLINYCDALTVLCWWQSCSQSRFRSAELLPRGEYAKFRVYISAPRQRVRRVISSFVSRILLRALVREWHFKSNAVDIRNVPSRAEPSRPRRIGGRNAAAMNLEIAPRTKCVIGFKQRAGREIFAADATRERNAGYKFDIFYPHVSIAVRY